MENVHVRAATAADIPGICNVNRGEEGPWSDLESCREWILNRMELGFYIQVAEICGRIVAHGEWCLSDEYRWRTLYLGQLQVDPEYQFRGIGRKMADAGIAQARKWGADSISLIPEQDTNSQIFYAKCGFERGKDIYLSTLLAEKGRLVGKIVEEAPREVIREKPFIFGLAQTSAFHMWQVFNRRPRGDKRAVATLVGDEFCIQLSGFDATAPAMLLAWAKYEDGAQVVKNARAFAYELGYPSVNLWFFPEMRPVLAAESMQTVEYEMYMRLN